jgi:fructose-6-phosphate aldolase 1
MRIFLDTADHRIAQKLWSWGSFSGVTTNPILLARAGASVEAAMADLGRATSGDLFAQAVGKTAQALADDGARLAQLVPGRIIVKIPTTPSGLEAMRLLSDKNVLTAATAIFRASQAVLAARAGATWVIPFWHRIAETGGDPAREVADSANFLERMLSSGVRSRVLCASLRSADEAVAALRAGATGITVSPDVAAALLVDPGTQAAVKQFDQAAKVQDDE